MNNFVERDRSLFFFIFLLIAGHDFRNRAIYNPMS